MNPDSDLVQAAEAMEEMHWLLCDYAQDAARNGVNGLNLLMGLAGVMVETTFLFEQPDEALDGLVAQIARRLNCTWSALDLPDAFLPAPYVLDREAEQGRDVARHVLCNQPLEEPYAFAEIVATLAQQHVLALEAADIPRDESFRVLVEFAQRAMVMEVAAQELCDVLIEHRVNGADWSLGDCIGALSGLAGYKVAVWAQGRGTAGPVRQRAQAQLFDQVADVMTREAVRYGIAGGTDWRFGLPANDLPPNPPSCLISGVLPFSESFFAAVRAFDPVYQATACAKAAGRMLAVASGGETPDLAPAIAKPLALGAMTDSYRSLL